MAGGSPGVASRPRSLTVGASRTASSASPIAANTSCASRSPRSPCSLQRTARLSVSDTALNAQTEQWTTLRQLSPSPSSGRARIAAGRSFATNSVDSLVTRIVPTNPLVDLDKLSSPRPGSSSLTPEPGASHLAHRPFDAVSPNFYLHSNARAPDGMSSDDESGTSPDGPLTQEEQDQLLASFADLDLADDAHGAHGQSHTLHQYVSSARLAALARGFRSTSIARPDALQLQASFLPPAPGAVMLDESAALGPLDGVWPEDAPGGSSHAAMNHPHTSLRPGTTMTTSGSAALPAGSPSSVSPLSYNHHPASAQAAVLAAIAPHVTPLQAGLGSSHSIASARPASSTDLPLSASPSELLPSPVSTKCVRSLMPPGRSTTANGTRDKASLLSSAAVFDLSALPASYAADRVALSHEIPFSASSSTGVTPRGHTSLHARLAVSPSSLLGDLSSIVVGGTSLNAAGSTVYHSPTAARQAGAQQARSPSSSPQPALAGGGHGASAPPLSQHAGSPIILAPLSVSGSAGVRSTPLGYTSSPHLLFDGPELSGPRSPLSPTVPHIARQTPVSPSNKEQAVAPSLSLSANRLAPLAYASESVSSPQIQVSGSDGGDQEDADTQSETDTADSQKALGEFHTGSLAVQPTHRDETPLHPDTVPSEQAPCDSHLSSPASPTPSSGLQVGASARARGLSASSNALRLRRGVGTPPSTALFLTPDMPTDQLNLTLLGNQDKEPSSATSALSTSPTAPPAPAPAVAFATRSLQQRPAQQRLFVLPDLSFPLIVQEPSPRIDFALPAPATTTTTTTNTVDEQAENHTEKPVTLQVQRPRSGRPVSPSISPSSTRPSSAVLSPGDGTSLSIGALGSRRSSAVKIAQTHLAPEPSPRISVDSTSDTEKPGDEVGNTQMAVALHLLTERPRTKRIAPERQKVKKDPPPVITKSTKPDNNVNDLIQQPSLEPPRRVSFSFAGQPVPKAPSGFQPSSRARRKSMAHRASMSVPDDIGLTQSLALPSNYITQHLSAPATVEVTPPRRASITPRGSFSSRGNAPTPEQPKASSSAFSIASCSFFHRCIHALRLIASLHHECFEFGLVCILAVSRFDAQWPPRCAAAAARWSSPHGVYVCVCVCVCVCVYVCVCE
jgi:hypothetical protein